MEDGLDDDGAPGSPCVTSDRSETTMTDTRCVVLCVYGLGAMLVTKTPLPQKHSHVPGVIKCVPANDDALKEDHRRLAERLRVYGLKEKVVRGDGNCQFRAFADQLFKSAARHEEVRKAAIKQLRLHAEAYRSFVPDDYKAYVDTMARDGTWGDHLSLQAAADAYGVRLMVMTRCAHPAQLTHTRRFGHEEHCACWRPSGPHTEEQSAVTRVVFLI